MQIFIPRWLINCRAFTACMGDLRAVITLAPINRGDYSYKAEWELSQWQMKPKY